MRRFLVFVVLPCAYSLAPSLRTRRQQIAGLASALVLGTAGGAQATVIDDEFKLADSDRNGKLTKSEFALWYKGNELLNEPPPVQLPIIALDLSALGIGLGGIYLSSYTWYITQKNAAEQATAQKKANRAAQAATKKKENTGADATSDDE